MADKPVVLPSFIERLEKCQDMIGSMCSEGRPPKMRIPAEAQDEDCFIVDTCGMMIGLLKGEGRFVCVEAERWQAEHEFFRKYAIGEKVPPSCLCCGQTWVPEDRMGGVQHMELAGIFVCKKCKGEAERLARMEAALQFYASREHMAGMEEWEAPSGEPSNWLCPPTDDGYMVEDGSIAREALAAKEVGK